MNWSNKRTQVKGWHHVSQCVDASWTTWSIYRPKKGIDWSRVKTNASVIDDLSWLVLFSTCNLQPICSPSEPSTESQNGNFRSCNLPVRTSDLQCLEQMVSDAFYQHFSSCAAQPCLKKLYQQVVNIIRLPLVCFFHEFIYLEKLWGNERICMWKADSIRDSDFEKMHYDFNPGTSHVAFCPKWLKSCWFYYKLNLPYPIPIVH